MLTGPRINAHFLAPSCALFLTCSGEKIYTVLYTIIQCKVINVRAVKCKNPYLGWWPLVQCSNFSPLQSHAMIQLPHFSQAVGPTPHPLIPPLSCIYAHMLYNYNTGRRRHQISSWSNTRMFVGQSVTVGTFSSNSC